MPGNNLTVTGIVFQGLTSNDAGTLTATSITVMYGSTTDPSLNGNYTLAISANDGGLPAVLQSLTSYINQVKVLKQIA